MTKGVQADNSRITGRGTGQSETGLLAMMEGCRSQTKRLPLGEKVENRRLQRATGVRRRQKRV